MLFTDPFPLLECENFEKDNKNNINLQALGEYRSFPKHCQSGGKNPFSVRNSLQL